MATTAFKVIVSTQELYTVWPAEAEEPLGWNIDEITEGSLAECLAYIGEVWQEEEPDAVLNEEEVFVVIVNEHDILSVTVGGVEELEGWETATEAVSLSEALAFIEKAWRGAGPLPEPFRPGTGKSPPDALAS